MMWKTLVSTLVFGWSARLVTSVNLPRDLLQRDSDTDWQCPPRKTVTVVCFHPENPLPTVQRTTIEEPCTVTIKGPTIQCQPSQTVVYIEPYCQTDNPVHKTLIATTAGGYQLGELVVPCPTPTSLDYYAPDIVIVNNIQVTLNIGSYPSASNSYPVSYPSTFPIVSPSASASPSTSPDNGDFDTDDTDIDYTCSAQMDIDDLALQDPIVAQIEEDLQITLTESQLEQVEDAFYYVSNGTTRETTIDLSFLLEGYTWTQEYIDPDDPLDPFDNCSTTIPIGYSYPDYYNFGDETESNPDLWDVSAFVEANSSETRRLFVRANTTNLATNPYLTSNSRLYSAELWSQAGMDAFMTQFIAEHPQLKTPTKYGFIADLLESVGLGNAQTGFQQCDISTCDTIEWKDSWTDKQKQVFYMFYSIRTRMLWLKTVNENLGTVQLNALGNMQKWIDNWWPSDVDKRGAAVGKDISDYLFKGVAQLTGLIPYVGKVVKFGVEGLDVLAAQKKDELRVKMRGVSWAEFGASFTGTGGLLDSYRNAISVASEALNKDPTADDGALTVLKGGTFFGQPTPFNAVAWRNVFETYIKHMVAASILRMQNVAFVYVPTANTAECMKIMDDNWRSFAGQQCTTMGLFIPIRANYYESHSKATKWQRAYYGTTIHSYNFALSEIKNTALYNELGSTIYNSALNCQNKISWRTSVYPDTGIGNSLGSDSLPSVENTCIYNMPLTIWKEGQSQDTTDFFKVASSTEKKWPQAQAAWMMAKIGFYHALYRDHSTSPKTWGISFGGK